MKGFKFIKKAKASKLPKNPGVYAFNKGKAFLYIGKASNLKERVENHFQKASFRDNLFIDEANIIGYQKTDSEIEALILEANLIKKYQPKYNVMWRDDKNYFWVAVNYNKKNRSKNYVYDKRRSKKQSKKKQSGYV